MRAREWLLIAASIAAYFVLEANEGPAANSWRLKRSSDPAMARLEIRHSRGFNHWQWGSDVPWSAIRGLTREQAGGQPGKVTFALVREAGALICEGTVRFGSGSGVFAFKADPDFAGELAKLGYARPTGDEVWWLAVHDVGLEFARSVREAGVAASLEELKKLRSHGVTIEEIGEAQEAGYHYAAEEFVRLRNHGVTLEFARTARMLGYDFTSNDLVELRNHQVDGAYLRRLKDAGYANLNARQIARLRSHGID